MVILFLSHITEISGITTVLSESCISYGAETVSYTHLDVYKRQAKYILLSYNNMAEKGNCRSNAKISDDDIMRILSQKGTVKVFEESYKAFTTGKSDISENAERLFLCICFNEE